VVSEYLIMRVSEQTEWMLHLFGQEVVRMGGDPSGSRIYYPQGGLETGAGYFPVQIILACTAIQSIMIFVGGILALKGPKSGEGVSGKPRDFHKNFHTYNRRRLWAFALTVPIIYVLNLFRNTIIIWMSGQDRAVGFTEDGAVTQWLCSWFTTCGFSAGVADNYAAFWFSHNIIGKGGSLLALIIIAFFVFKILPELYDSVIGLLDLRQRRGPLERWFAQRFGRGGNGGTPSKAPKPGDPTHPAAAATRTGESG
jgi:exosortase/archaeosortase family protein